MLYIRDGLAFVNLTSGTHCIMMPLRGVQKSQDVLGLLPSEASCFLPSFRSVGIGTHAVGCKCRICIAWRTGGAMTINSAFLFPSLGRSRHLLCFASRLPSRSAAFKTKTLSSSIPRCDPSSLPERKCHFSGFAWQIPCPGEKIKHIQIQFAPP